MIKPMKIALIPPINRADYLVNTVIDGMLTANIEFAVPDYEYPSPYNISHLRKSEGDFIAYATEADLIILGWGKTATNYRLAEQIGKWDKTVFVDGSELGKNRRYDMDIRKSVENMTYEGIGAIDKEMLNKCALYFRRERPYVEGVIPLPFGIESRYIHHKPGVNKDIDFTCIFGQEDFPILRKEVREALESYCKKKGLKSMTKRTKGFSFDDDKKVAGRDQFYETLARSKVGVSVGGGGYDTARFWEILGNNCILLTEKIDIFEAGSKALDYKRIYQFTNLEDFISTLDTIDFYTDPDEYEKILSEHSSRARVMTILEAAKRKGIIKV